MKQSDEASASYNEEEAADAESNKSITISALDGNITSQQYLIWDPQDVYIKNSNIYSIGDGNIYSQSQGIE